MHNLNRWYWLVLPLVLLAGCSQVYYNTMEKFGFEKRDILVDRVEDARDAQQDAKDEFSSALEEFQAMFGREESDLQDQYDTLSAAYDDSLSAANKVRKRIDAVEDVSAALFREWEEELELYSSAELRQDSAAKLRTTKRDYQQLIQAMRAAESRMDPVLRVLQDQVLYLKHNLNARAINRLQGELKSVEKDVARLIQEMEKSIAESEAFIRQMERI